jgi:hypothetical protein
MTLTTGWALYVVVPFLLFAAGVVVMLAAGKKPWR